MEKTLWERLTELKQSVNGGVTPKDTVTLRTKTVKIALAGYLAQSIIIALSWAIRDGNAVAWFIPISAFIHIGWFWNKCIEHWKRVQDVEPFVASGEIPTPPTIVISNSPIIPRNNPQANSMDSLWHTAPESLI